MAILSGGIGYFILLGVGLIMSVAVALLVRAETKWLGTKKTSEWFATAGRTIKTGLLASSVVSAWTWAATLLQSSTVAYEFGISGPFWYAAGASIQIVLFAILAIEVKRKAPSSHTFPEIIYVRFGKHSHKVFLAFALMTNTIVTAMLVLGGAAVVNSLTGINIYIAAFLIPVGVIIYTFFGGLKATFLADYLNTVFLFIVVLAFVAAIYFTNPQIGGISGMYAKLTNAAIIHPVDGNSAGSYLTLSSSGALVFGIINIAGNFGTVFVGQAYWQRAVAAAPRSAFKGFLVGGLAWFAIPFTLATSLGLAAVAMGLSLSEDQISMGLVAPTVVSHLLGDVGAIFLLTILFTAVTSAGSAELVSVSTLLTYDIYRTYVRPSASGRQLMRMSRIAILGFGMSMGMFALILLQVGASLQYMYLAMGVLIGSAVAPVTLAVVWKKTNKAAAIAGAVGGLICGVTVWLISALLIYGNISITSTEKSIPLLAGNLTSISLGAGTTIIGSLIKPENFDFRVMKQKILIADAKVRRLIASEYDEDKLKHSSMAGRKLGLGLTLVLVVAWPMPLYFSGYLFSQEVYYLWVGIAIAWAGIAAGIIIVLPLFESRNGILIVLQKITQKRRNEDSSKIIVQQQQWDRGNYDNDDDNRNSNNNPSSGAFQKKILVPVDGSPQSLRALNYAASMFHTDNSMHPASPSPSHSYSRYHRSSPSASIPTSDVKIYLLNVIEWADEKEEESLDDDLISAMEEKGRKMLTNVLVPAASSSGDYCIRIVKLGDPPSMIVEIAEKLKVDMIVMGATGLGVGSGNKSRSNNDELGHVSQNVLKLTSLPIVFLK